jgi:hypothetical protein
MASTSTTTQKTINYWHVSMICMVAIETALVMMGLVPAQLWTRLLPQSSASALDGPFPPVIAPIITALLYFLPSIIGFLCRNWQRALLYATLPAWIGLGAFLIAATFKVGIFYLVSADHVTAQASMLEMFAALGGIGWLGRHLFKSH